MIKEKHNWTIVKEYFTTMGDVEHHTVIEYKECKKCGARERLKL